MSTSEELFPQSSLTPEEQVKENQRLNDIDDIQRAKARDIFAHQAESSEEARREKAEFIFELTGNAADTAKRMIEELDPSFQDAQNITISETISKPSRLLFLKKEVVIPQKREIAAWNLYAPIHLIILPHLGRDGILYATHDSDQHYATKKIDLPSLHMEELISLQEGLGLLIEPYERKSRS